MFSRESLLGRLRRLPCTGDEDFLARVKLFLAHRRLLSRLSDPPAKTPRLLAPGSF